MPMTADEIKEAKEDYRSQVGWIKELCWQVACLNEHMEAHAKCEQSTIQQAPGFASAIIGSLAAEAPRQKRKYVRKAKIA